MAQSSSRADTPARTRGETTATQNGRETPRLPHEHDESRHSQEASTPGQQAVGNQAYRNATDGTQDTDRGPSMDKVYNEQVAPDRGPSRPRQ